MFVLVLNFYAFAGLHPDGIPCQRKDSVKFESITRDVRRDPICVKCLHKVDIPFFDFWLLCFL